jgi:hypothetical protein
MTVTNNTGIDFDADLGTIIGDLPDTFTNTNAGTDVVCAISTVNKGTVLDGIEGPAGEISFEIVVRQSLCSSAPTVDQSVTVNSTNYRILRVETDETGGSYNLICGAYTA